MDKNLFKHKIDIKVRFYEVDMLGVCNNAVYINYFEQARLDYIKDLGFIPEGGIFSDNNLFFIVRNEIDYKGHARFDDELIIYSRISYIKNSSFGFEHIVESKKNGQIIAEGAGVIARVDPLTRKSTSLSGNFVEAVQKFEKQLQVLR